MNYENYLGNGSLNADLEARIAYAKDLLTAFKVKNISEGIQWYHAVHLHSRLRDWQVNYPTALGGGNDRVDIINMIVSGDIETATLSMMFGVPDEMNLPIHWMNTERIAWIISQNKRFLGWP